MNFMYKLLIILMLTPMAACSNRMNGPTDNAQPTISFNTGSSSEPSFKVEIADTNESRARGLMYRSHLDQNSGMLFIFGTEANHVFWMKNTYIPLDMIFLSSDWLVVGIIHDAEPMTLDERSVGRPSRYVLEINGGLSVKLGITEGREAVFPSTQVR